MRIKEFRLRIDPDVIFANTIYFLDYSIVNVVYVFELRMGGIDNYKEKYTD